MKAKKRDLHGVVIGLGSIGNRHVRTLQSQISKITVVRREQANSHFQPPANVAVVTDLEAAISRRPDFAVVCNPSHLHVATTSQLLANEIPCLIEKPLGSQIDEASQHLAEQIAASPVGAGCAMAYCMRYHRAYRTAKQFVQQGMIGRCLYAKAHFEGYLPDWHPWEDYHQSYAARTDCGGGALRTLDHEIDFMNWLLGPALASSGIACCSGGIKIEADDVAMLSSLHPHNTVSQITLALCRKPGSRGFELIGDQGSVQFLMEAEKLIVRNVDGKVLKKVHCDKTDINAMYVDMMADYLKLVADGSGSSALATVEDGLASLRVIDRVAKSDLSHRLSIQ